MAATIRTAAQTPEDSSVPVWWSVEGGLSGGFEVWGAAKVGASARATSAGFDIEFLVSKDVTYSTSSVGELPGGTIFKPIGVLVVAPPTFADKKRRDGLLSGGAATIIVMWSDATLVV
jgi:hypothetical protein